MLGLNIADTCRYRSIIIHVAILYVFASIFVKYDDKYANKRGAKPLGALCAVLP